MIVGKNTLEVECSAIKADGRFQIENTGRGEDISPEFFIKNLSSEAKTLAIILEDLSHPIKNFTHWVIWNIPANKTIKKGIVAGKSLSNLGNAKQGIGYGWHCYAGPKPPRGKKHTYRFTIYALDCKLDLKASSFKRNFLKVAKQHIIQVGAITGVFE